MYAVNVHTQESFVKHPEYILIIERIHVARKDRARCDQNKDDVMFLKEGPKQTQGEGK